MMATASLSDDGYCQTSVTTALCDSGDYIAAAGRDGEEGVVFPSTPLEIPQCFFPLGFGSTRKVWSASYYLSSDCQLQISKANPSLNKVHQ